MNVQTDKMKLNTKFFQRPQKMMNQRNVYKWNCLKKSEKINLKRTNSGKIIFYIQRQMFTFYFIRFYSIREKFFRFGIFFFFLNQVYLFSRRLLFSIFIYFILYFIFAPVEHVKNRVWLSYCLCQCFRCMDEATFWMCYLLRITYLLCFALLCLLIPKWKLYIGYSPILIPLEDFCFIHCRCFILFFFFFLGNVGARWRSFFAKIRNMNFAS